MRQVQCNAPNKDHRLTSAAADTQLAQGRTDGEEDEPCGQQKPELAKQWQHLCSCGRMCGMSESADSAPHIEMAYPLSVCFPHAPSVWARLATHPGLLKGC